jgi:3-isopropylmalate dehydrogenase
MKARIAVLPGDGIGPEVTAEAVRALRAVAARFHHDFDLVEAPVGAAAMEAGQDPLPAPTLALARECDAVLFGAIGSPRYSDPASKVRPEQAILALRQSLGLFANLRPVAPQAALRHAAPVRGELLDGVDLLIVRELTGGIYFGRRTRDAGSATDECRYGVAEVERIARVAFRLSAARRSRVTSVDKANVLETSRLWRETVTRVAREEFPAIALEHQLVDSAAMLLLTRPASYDVVVTENLFGDILSDEASMLAGSMGLLPSASLGSGIGLYEPVHGSAPDIAGRGVANPVGAIASAAMLLRYSFALKDEARAIEAGIEAAFAEGFVTADLAASGRARSTREVGDFIANRVLKN